MTIAEKENKGTWKYTVIKIIILRVEWYTI